MVDGFVYVPHDDPDLMRLAAPGRRVMKPTLEPPWLVVDHALETVIVVRWPGRLFRVTVVPPRTGPERATMTRITQEVLPGASYSRALAVDVIEELPPTMLSGRHGDAVAAVLTFGASLTEDLAAELALRRDPGAAQACRAAWQRWQAGAHRKAADVCPSGMLAVHSLGRAGSPINNGFLVLDDVVRTAAKQRGTDALVPDGDGNLVLTEPWSTAESALIEAAMALGAPDLVTEAEAAVLTVAWRTAT
jgi:hypothetical protein